MKRIASLSLALLLCFSAASATSDGIMRASPTLDSYSVKLWAGYSSGAINIDYDVSGKFNATECGVSSIVIYKEDGTHVASITGSISNGLLVKKSSHTGTYIYYGTPGQSYFAIVTIYAKVDTTSDSREITTGTVQAP